MCFGPGDTWHTALRGVMFTAMTAAGKLAAKRIIVRILGERRDRRSNIRKLEMSRVLRTYADTHMGFRDRSRPGSVRVSSGRRCS